MFASLKQGRVRKIFGLLKTVAELKLLVFILITIHYSVLNHTLMMNTKKAKCVYYI